LHHWLGRPDCPPALKECKKLFEKVYSQKGYQYAGVLRAFAKHNGVVYATSTAHLGNSLVQFYPGSNKNSSPVPGSIQHIFYQEENLFFAVKHQECAIGDMLDLFKPYAHFPMKLYSPKLSGQLKVVEVDWVVSHYARWPISLEHVVVLSL
ncbi:hypothetical protein K439DRAFT_1282777, partial [Ramaria rubella]